MSRKKKETPYITQNEEEIRSTLSKMSHTLFQSTLTQMEAINPKPTPKTKMSQKEAIENIYSQDTDAFTCVSQGTPAISGSQQENKDRAIFDFTFDDYDPGKRYDVLVDNEDNKVPITAPRFKYSLTYDWVQPNMIKSRQATCKDPEWNCMNETVIPFANCYDYLIYDKRYIKYHCSVLNGKINFWRIESLKQLRKAQLELGKMVPAVCKQENFAMERGAYIQKMIAEYEGPAISMLNHDGIECLVLRCGHHTDDEAELIYRMCKHTTFELFINPGDHHDEFDLITRFDKDIKIENCFGKPYSERILPSNESKKISHKKRRAHSDSSNSSA